MPAGERMTIEQYRELVKQGPPPAERVKAGRLTRTPLNSIHLSTSEDSVASVLEDYFNTKGYLWFHDRDPVRNRAGFPDYVAVHPCGAGPFWVEAKSETGRLRSGQQLWRAALLLSDAHYWVARPSNIDEILAEMDELLTEARQASADT